MRVGILTFHYAVNYGAVLQAYATQRLLQDLGYEVEMIDYRNRKILKDCNPWLLQRSLFLRSPIRYILTYFPCAISSSCRNYAFSCFRRKWLRISKKRYSPENRELDGYDVVLVGSDQVWNPRCTGGYDPYYWARYRTSARIVAWAASMNRKVLDVTEEETVRRYLSVFSDISVREEALKDLLQPLTEKAISVLADPTLMLPRMEWEQVAGDSVTSGYVLAYPMLEEDKVIEVADMLANSKGLRCVVITNKAYWRPRKGFVQWAPPDKFLAYFRDADYVVTSSFHGTAFALQFAKPFLSIASGPNLRVSSLLWRLNMMDRLSDGSDWQKIDGPIDFTDLGHRLAAFQKDGVEFLRNKKAR